MSNRRIPTAQTPAQLATEQLHQLRPYFRERPITLGDRYYPTKEFLVGISGEYDLLLRLKANRVFYRTVEPSVEKRGRGAPPKHGPRFQCNAPLTHGETDQEWSGEDESGKKIQVREWRGLHLREAPETNLNVICVRRYGASGKRRDPIESWFGWVGQTPVELAEVWPLYKRRYAIEHGYRFDKQDLLWSQPRLRYPAQFELWTAIVSMVHNQLQLAAGLAGAVLRPWESNQRPVSPKPIRRGFGAIIEQLGTPARPCQKRGKGRGRAFGAKIEPAVRYKVVKKGRKKAKSA